MGNKKWQNQQNYQSEKKDFPIFRSPTDFVRMLSTKEDVIKCCVYERRRLESETTGNKDPHFLPSQCKFV